jgi:thioesterase domain-containing protein
MTYLDALTRSMRAQIPLVDFLDLSLDDARPERVVVKAPLAPAKNHRGTAFGPSVITVAALATWLRVVLKAQRNDLRVRILLRSCEFELFRPVEADFSAECSETVDWSLDAISEGERVRLSLHTDVSVGERQVGRYSGHFVLVPCAPTDPSTSPGDLELPPYPPD